MENDDDRWRGTITAFPRITYGWVWGATSRKGARWEGKEGRWKEKKERGGRYGRIHTFPWNKFLVTPLRLRQKLRWKVRVAVIRQALPMTASSTDHNAHERFIIEFVKSETFITIRRQQLCDVKYKISISMTCCVDNWGLRSYKTLMNYTGNMSGCWETMEFCGCTCCVFYIATLLELQAAAILCRVPP